MSNNNGNYGNYGKTETSAQSPIEAMLQMMSGFWVSRGIYVVAKLGVADHLRDGAKTSEELAAATATHADSLYRILRMMGTVGVFRQDGENRFALTPLSETLLSDASMSLRESAIIEMGEVHYEAWGNLLHTVKTGDIAFDSHFGMNIWEYFEQHPQNAQTFNRYMANSSALMNEAIGKTDVFADSSRIVDVGGGLGGMITTILKANPQLEGTLFDAPSVVEKSKDFIAEKDLSDRCKTVGGDFFESVPAGGDVYTMRWIIHDWEDSKSIKILENIRSVLPENGKLVLAEAVVPANGQPHYSKFFDLIMLTITGGRERTESEYAALLEKAGFKLKRIIPTDTFLSIIEAVPA
jgi:SAM-dependent methyltransferase